MEFGLKQQMKIVVPVLLGLAIWRLAAGAQIFEGVVGGGATIWGLKSQITYREGLQ